MNNSLLLSIREGLLQARPLPELLRSCIFLGNDTDSSALQNWARKELEGYETGDPIPSYRRFELPPLLATIQAGWEVRKNLVMGPHNFPERAREQLPKEIEFKQPVVLLQEYSKSDQGVSFVPGKLLLAREIYNDEAAPLNQILELKLSLSNTEFSGIIDTIRTRLTSMIAELTRNSPMENLPTTEEVERIVNKYIQNNYETKITNAAAPVAIGTNATASQTGLDVNEILMLIDGLNLDEFQVSETERNSISALLEETRTELESGKPKQSRLIGLAKKLLDFGQDASNKALGAYATQLGSNLAEVPFPLA